MRIGKRLRVRLVCCLAEWYRSVPKGQALRPEIVIWSRPPRPIHCYSILLCEKLTLHAESFNTRAALKLAWQRRILTVQGGMCMRCREPSGVGLE